MHRVDQAPCWISCSSLTIKQNAGNVNGVFLCDARSTVGTTSPAPLAGKVADDRLFGPGEGRVAYCGLTSTTPGPSLAATHHSHQ